ncbi:speckle-type POZ protein-like B [Nasonia vitripennis]|uniref:Roadkill n=1 Tax=Nasonia vitripennis TaxID=7425 RepID=A0A7M7T7J6_NASVI|nr:speckle-type POZ protein-like B [Nasonia vitripennis]XP_031780229.1 speckle-type POZ protein-like B [Nasonia vitripennis]
MDQHKLCLRNHGETRTEIIECTYDWTITNFQYHARGDVGQSIESPVFKAGPKNELRWKLYLYPGGCIEDHNKDVSVDLCCLDEYSNCINIFIAIARNDGKSCDVQKKLRIPNSSYLNQISNQNRCLFPDFVKRSYLVEKASDVYFNEGSLKLKCHLIFGNGLVYDPQPTTTLLSIELDTTIDFKQFFDSSKFSDAKLVLNGGTEIAVHRIILSACSPVFAAMFEKNMKEQRENRVEITDVDAKVMREVLRFVYTGKVNNDIKAIASNLFEAADKYAIDGLKKTCENSLIQGLNLMNVGNILEIADRHGAEALKTAALNFIAVHVEELANSEMFRTSMRSTCHLLGEMLNALKLKYK